MQNRLQYNYPLLIDCHAHLPYNPKSPKGMFQLKSILRRCDNHEIEGILYSMDYTDGHIEADFNFLHNIFKNYDVKIKIATGHIPPCSLEKSGIWEEQFQKAFETIKKLCKEDIVAAIGEVGLDYYWPLVDFLSLRKKIESKSEIDRIIGKHSNSLKKEEEVINCLNNQKKFFEKWVKLAMEMDIPLVIHDREASYDVFNILQKCNISPEKVMFHCCSSSTDYAVKLAKEGYWISVPSSITHKEQYVEIAKAVDLKNMLIETDSPYQSPIAGHWKRSYQTSVEKAKKEGLKGKKKDSFIEKNKLEIFKTKITKEFSKLEFEVDNADTKIDAVEYFKKSKHRSNNEPTFVRLAAREISEVKKCDYNEVCTTLRENAAKLFNF